MSEAAREANLEWLGRPLEELLAGCFQNCRDLDAEELQTSLEHLPELVEAADGDLARLAQQQKTR